MSFPPSLIYTWDTKNPVEDVNNIINSLSFYSSYSVSFEIEILLKFAKQKQSNSFANRGVKIESQPLYFVRQPDIGATCLITKDKQKSDITLCKDNEIDEMYINLMTRSTWKASGQKFYIGSTLISVGYIVHVGSNAKPCIEITYYTLEENEKNLKINENKENEELKNININENTDEKDNEIMKNNDMAVDKIEKSEDELHLIAYQLHQIVLDLLKANTASNTAPIGVNIPSEKTTENIQQNDTKNELKNEIKNDISIETMTSIEINKENIEKKKTDYDIDPLIVNIKSRALQWLSIMI